VIASLLDFHYGDFKSHLIFGMTQERFLEYYSDSLSGRRRDKILGVRRMKRQEEETKNLGDFEVSRKCVQKKGVEDWRSLFKVKGFLKNIIWRNRLSAFSLIFK
jgi:hypothetical protein